MMDGHSMWCEYFWNTLYSCYTTNAVYYSHVVSKWHCFSFYSVSDHLFLAYFSFFNTNIIKVKWCEVPCPTWKFRWKCLGSSLVSRGFNMAAFLNSHQVKWSQSNLTRDQSKAFCHWLMKVLFLSKDIWHWLFVQCICHIHIRISIIPIFYFFCPEFRAS